jgi:hypothetical protein
MVDTIENFESRLNIEAVNCSLIEGENLQIIIHDFDPEGCTQVNYTVFTIDDDCPIFCKTFSSSAIREDNNIKINCNFNNDLKQGFYGLSRLKFSKPTPSGVTYYTLFNVINDNKSTLQGVTYPIYNDVNDNDLVLFEVRQSNETPHTPQELLAKYEEIKRKINDEFFSGVGCSPQEQGTKEYEGFVFVKNCLITMRMKLGRYEITPFRHLPFTDESTLIQTFANSINIGLLIKQNAFKGSINLQPVFIAHFPKIYAHTVEEAGDIIEQETKSLSDLLSIHRSSYGSIFGTIIIDIAEKKPFYRIITPWYSGNLLGGIVSGENHIQIKREINKIKNNTQLQLYLSLYTDILLEEKNDFMFFRCWNLLETIANSKNFIGKPLLDAQGNPQYKGKKLEKIKKDNAVQLVFELIRVTNNTFNDGMLANILQNDKVRIWYRRRNCIAHRGGCFPNDTNCCNRTDSDFIKCKQDYDNGVDNLRSILYALTRVINNELR